MNPTVTPWNLHSLSFTYIVSPKIEFQEEYLTESYVKIWKNDFFGHFESFITPPQL